MLNNGGRHLSTLFYIHIKSYSHSFVHGRKFVLLELLLRRTELITNQKGVKLSVLFDTNLSPCGSLALAITVFTESMGLSHSSCKN